MHTTLDQLIRGDGNTVRRALIVALLAIAGAVTWGYFCQASLRNGQLTLRSLLGLPLAVAVGLTLGLLLKFAATGRGGL